MIVVDERDVDLIRLSKDGVTAKDICKNINI